jgi:hypothetical protein
MTWPGSPGAARGGPGYPWGESVALVVRAALLAGTAWHIGPHEHDRLDNGNVLGPVDVDGRLWVDLACDVTTLEILDSSTTGAGVVSRDEAATATLELYDPARQYDPANSDGPYWLHGHSRLAAGTPLVIGAEVLDGAGGVDTFTLFAGLIDTWAASVEPLAVERRAQVSASGAIKRAAGLDYGAEPVAVGAGDTPAMRLSRLLARFGWAGTVAQYGPTSSATMPATTFDGALWEQVADTADAEIGFVRLTAPGDLELFTRGYFVSPIPPPALVLGCGEPGAHDVATDLELAAIDAQLRNAVYANRASAGSGDTPVVQVARSQSSIDRHGGREAVYRADRLELQTDVQVGEWAQWVVALFAYPEPAPRTVTLLPARLGETTGELWRAVLGLRVLHDVLRVLWTPAASAPLDTRSWVVGVRHSVTPTSWTVRYDLLPADRLAANVWHIGTHPRDRLDDHNVLGWVAHGPTVDGAALLTSTATLRAAGEHVPLTTHDGAALLTATATLSATGVHAPPVTHDGAATLSSAATLDATGTSVTPAGHDGAAVLTSTATLTGTAEHAPPASWSPPDLPGLLGWWDAADPASIVASAGRVSSWADKSGAGRHLAQATAGKQPLTGSVTIGGRNALKFDATRGDIVTRTPVSAPAVNTGTWFIAFRPRSPLQANERVFSFDAGGDDWNTAAAILPVVRSGGAGNFVCYYAGGSTYGDGSPILAQDTAYVFTTQRSAAGVLQVWSHGVTRSDTVGGTGNFAFTRLHIGGNPTSGGPANIDVGEAIWYEGALNATDRTTVENYLRTKWSAA